MGFSRIGGVGSARDRALSLLSGRETSAKFCLQPSDKQKGGPKAAFRIVECALSSRQLPAPLSAVTARRFCDQQEMSSQTATGRSLP